MTSPVVSIIGTAGRKADGERLTRGLYLGVMSRVVGELERRLPAGGWCLQSGGAAWMDHIAVQLFLHDSRAASLILRLPASLSTICDGSVFNGMSTEGRISNFYHLKFMDKTGFKPREDIRQAIERGAILTVHGGFHERNLRVAQCDLLIASTFAEGDTPKDGGTKHTWSHARQDAIKVHIPVVSKEAQQLAFVY